jgi:2-polyprenyl-3-methyl-5-hydroxy-6-metoxy-1,4-benzoquinol methylase
MRIISEERLRYSPVVANCRMNRKRQLAGNNSYVQELGFNPGEFLLKRVRETAGSVRWLDLCCGEGIALIQFAQSMAGTEWADRIEIVGVDLVGMFSTFNNKVTPALNLIDSSIEDWTSPHTYDLITCIHGLHYLGDKLSVLCRIGLMLKPDGQYYGSFSPTNILNETGKPLTNWLNGQFKTFGWTYSDRRHLLSRSGWSDWPQNWIYLGADDQAGPNYTGQEAVNSYYRLPVPREPILGQGTPNGSTP